MVAIICLVWFYSTPSIERYLLPNPFLYIVTVLFQTIQLSNSVQMSLAVLFHAIQFRIRTQFNSIWPIDWALSVATTSGQSGPCTMAIRRYSTFHNTPALLEPHHYIVYCFIQDTPRRDLTSPQRNSLCIPQPQPTGQDTDREMERERED